MDQKTTFDVELDDREMELLIEQSVKARCSPKHLLNHLAREALQRARRGELVLPARKPSRNLH